MRTTKTDEAESDEDDLEEEYRKHGKGVLSFIVVAFESSSFVKVRLSFYYSRVLFLLCRAIKRGRKSNNNYLGFQGIPHILTRSHYSQNKSETRKHA